MSSLPRPKLAIVLGSEPPLESAWCSSGLKIFIDLRIDPRVPETFPILASKVSDIPHFGASATGAVMGVAHPNQESGDYGLAAEGEHYAKEEREHSRSQHLQNCVRGSKLESYTRGLDRNAQEMITANADLTIADDERESTSQSTLCSSEDGFEFCADGAISNTLYPVRSPAIESFDGDDIAAACQLLRLSARNCCAGCRGRHASDRHSKELRNLYGGRSTLDDLSALVETLCVALPELETTGWVQEDIEPWSSYHNDDIGMRIANDHRTFRVKRIKPNKGKDFTGYETNEDDEVLDRPPHKRLYKSLRKLAAS